VQAVCAAVVDGQDEVGEQVSHVGDGGLGEPFGIEASGVAAVGPTPAGGLFPGRPPRPGPGQGSASARWARDHRERVGEHARGDVVVPGSPGPHLVLVQADEVLALFVVLLAGTSWPAGSSSDKLDGTAAT
jgi:hypothetical protein